MVSCSASLSCSECRPSSKKEREISDGWMDGWIRLKEQFKENF